MINTQFLVPDVYYKESRDFQFFGRLYDFLFNYLKTEIDLIRAFPTDNNLNSTFYLMLLKSMGLQLNGSYDVNLLKALSKTWAKVIRNKGSRQGINEIITIILRASDNNSNYLCEYIPPNSQSEITGDWYQNPTFLILIQQQIQSKETMLLEEVLDYILPIGVNVVIQNVTILAEYEDLILQTNENMVAKNVGRNITGSVYKGETVNIDVTGPTTSSNDYIATNTGSYTNQSHVWVGGSVGLGTVYNPELTAKELTQTISEENTQVQSNESIEGEE